MPRGITDGLAVWPPMPTEDELTTAGLSADGQHVRGWVKVPAGKVWRPEELLWLPPSAQKSTDIDRAGEIVDVVEIGDMAWVTAQLALREKYLDHLRAKVRAGAFRLTAASAKFLDLPFDGDGAELTPRVSTGTLAYQSLDVEQLVAEGRRLVGLRVDCDTGLPIVPGRN